MAKVYLNEDGDFVYESVNMLGFTDDFGITSEHGHMVLPGIYEHWHSLPYTRYKPVVTCGGVTVDGLPYSYHPWQEICTGLNTAGANPGPVTFHFENVLVNPNLDYGHGKVKVAAFICLEYDSISQTYYTRLLFPTRIDRVYPYGIETHVDVQPGFNWGTYTSDNPRFLSKFYEMKWGSFATYEEAVAKARSIQSSINFPTWVCLEDTAPTTRLYNWLYANTQVGQDLDAWLKSDEGWEMDTIWTKPKSILNAINAYILNAENGDFLPSLQNYLWTLDVGTDKISNQLYANPMECILSLGFIPFRYKTENHGSNDYGPLYLGTQKVKVSGNVVEVPLLVNEYLELNLGTKEIERVFNDYRDFTETQIQIYLPCIGWHNLDPQQVMNASLTIKYRVNFVTGEIICLLCLGNQIIDTVQGNCMQQIPYSGRDFTNLLQAQLQKKSAAAAAIGSFVGAVGSAVSGNVAGVGASLGALAGSALADQGADIAVTKAQNQVCKDGNIGGSSAILGYPDPYIVIQHHEDANATGYQNYEGYQCNKILTISTLTGYFRCKEVYMASSSATDEELAEIENLLKGGCFV